jgi:hypothetical protein
MLEKPFTIPSPFSSTTTGFDGSQHFTIVGFALVIKHVHGK